MTRPVRQVETPLSLQFQDAGGSILYVGEAIAGAATSAPLWRIFRVNTSSGVIIQWADGNPYFDNVWDDRASLNYV